jgi:hypothetical protein
LGNNFSERLRFPEHASRAGEEFLHQTLEIIFPNTNLNLLASLN